MWNNTVAGSVSSMEGGLTGGQEQNQGNLHGACGWGPGEGRRRSEWDESAVWLGRAPSSFKACSEGRGNRTRLWTRWQIWRHKGNQGEGVFLFLTVCKGISLLGAQLILSVCEAGRDTLPVLEIPRRGGGSDRPSVTQLRSQDSWLRLFGDCSFYYNSLHFLWKKEINIK